MGIRIAEKAFTMFRAMLRPADCEKELQAAMEMYIRRAGGTASSFPPIIAVGSDRPEGGDGEMIPDHWSD